MKLAVHIKKLPESLYIGDDTTFQRNKEHHFSRGAFGKVYKALMKNAGKVVAIKVPEEWVRDKEKARCTLKSRFELGRRTPLVRMSFYICSGRKSLSSTS